MVRPCAAQRQLTTGDAERSEERGHLDAIRHHDVFHGAQFVHPVDRDHRTAGTEDPSTHPVQERSEIRQLRLAGRVVDRRAARCEHTGHQQVLGGADAGVLQHDLGSDETIDATLDHPVAEGELRAERLETREVHVDGPGPEVVAAGHRHTGLADRGEQRAEHRARCAHALDELVGRLGNDRRATHHLDRPVLAAPGGDAHRLEQRAHVRNVGDLGHVAQHVAPLGEHACGHQLQRRVLRSGDLHLTAQGTGRTNQQAAHAIGPRHSIGSSTPRVTGPVWSPSGCVGSDRSSTATRTNCVVGWRPATTSSSQSVGPTRPSRPARPPSPGTESTRSTHSPDGAGQRSTPPTDRSCTTAAPSAGRRGPTTRRTAPSSTSSTGSRSPTGRGCTTGWSVARCPTGSPRGSPPGGARRTGSRRSSRRWSRRWPCSTSWPGCCSGCSPRC